MKTKAEDEFDELSFQLLARANALVVMRLLFEEFDNHHAQSGEGKGKTEAGSDENRRANLTVGTEKRFKRI